MVTSMKSAYRIERCESGFVIFDPWGERLVDVFPTEEAAKQDIERCKKKDAMRQTAKLLVETAITAHMKIHGVDRETALYWINSAMG